jgi:uncharacterized protein YjbJ (UPF0337 family)
VTRDRDLGTRGKAERKKGQLNQGVGKAEQQLGEATGNSHTRGHGTERRGKGKLQEGVGKAKEAVDDLTDH